MSRILLAVVVSALMLIVAACAADDADTDDADVADEPTPTEEPDATPTPEPTPSPSPSPEIADDATDDAVVDDVDDDDDALRDDEDPTDDDDAMFEDDLFDDADDALGMDPDDFLEDFEDAELAALLLEVDELPDGWEVVYEGSLPADLDPTMGMGDIDAGPCDNDPVDMQDLGDPTQVGRFFMTSELGPYFGQDLMRYENSDEAGEMINTIAGLFDCESWTEEDPMSGSEIEFTVEELDFPDLGDEILALSIGISMDMDVHAGAERVSLSQMDDLFGDVSTEMVLVRHNNLVTNFTHIDPLGMGNIDLEEIVTQAVEKIEDGHQE